MFVAILALITSLAIAAVAGYTSIIGLMALFSASALTVGVIAGILEVAKLVTASWLYRNWKDTSVSLRTYLTTSVIVLMFITSMGIFGFLSKAYLEQTAPVSNNTAKIERIDKKIETELSKIADSEKIISQLDASVDTLIEYDRIRGPSGAIAVRESQEEQRQLLASRISESRTLINSLEDERFQLNSEVLAVQAEIGPLKYVAALIYDNPEENIDNSVRIIILLLIFVFDPLAVLLLIAANQSLMRIQDVKKENAPESEDTEENQERRTNTSTGSSERHEDMGTLDNSQPGDGEIDGDTRFTRDASDIPHSEGKAQDAEKTELPVVPTDKSEVQIDGQEEAQGNSGNQISSTEDVDVHISKESEMSVRNPGSESSTVREEAHEATGRTSQDEAQSPEEESATPKRKNVILAKLPTNVADKYQKK